MKNQQPNAVQRRWREDVRTLGPIGCEIHHCVGRTGRHNKVAIGHWWILPLSTEGHRKIHWMRDRKDQEKTLWKWLLAAYEERFGQPPPVPLDVQTAILEYRK